MEVPDPAAARKRMEAVVGEWTGTETLHPSKWNPEGSEAEGYSLNKLALGGMAILNDYEQRIDGRVTFTGHGVSTYDAEEQCYAMHWFDSLGNPPSIYKGTFEGDVLTLDSENSVAGWPRFSRIVYDLSKPDEMKSRMETSEDRKSWDVQLDVTYKRTGASSPGKS